LPYSPNRSLQDSFDCTKANWVSPIKQSSARQRVSPAVSTQLECAKVTELRAQGSGSFAQSAHQAAGRNALAMHSAKECHPCSPERGNGSLTLLEDPARLRSIQNPSVLAEINCNFHSAVRRELGLGIT